MQSFAVFGGSMLAGLVGTLWSRASHSGFFLVLAALAIVAAVLLWLLDRPIRNHEAASAPAPNA